MIKYVQFLDATEEEIVSIFGCQQDPKYYKFLGTVEDTDQRYLSFLAEHSFLIGQ